jgi:hypothetical protein
MFCAGLVLGYALRFLQLLENKPGLFRGGIRRADLPPPISVSGHSRRAF